MGILLKVELEKVSFVTTNSNRQVKKDRLVNNIKENKGVDIPPIVFKVSDFLEDDVEFRDLMTEDPLDKSNIPEESYIIADGQHRIAACLRILQERKEQKKVFNGNFTQAFDLSSLDVILYNKTDLRGRSLTEFIANINGTASNWKGNDYIHMLYTEKGNNQEAKVIETMREAGMSMSTISRYLAFDNKKLKNQSLIDYTAGKTSAFDDLVFNRGLRVLALFLKKGFSLHFLKKRYLIDYVIDENRIGKLNECLEAISYISNEGVHNIEELSPEDLSPMNLRKFIEEEKKATGVNRKTVSIPTDDIVENLNYLKKKIEGKVNQNNTNKNKKTESKSLF